MQERSADFSKTLTHIAASWVADSNWLHTLRSRTEYL